MNACGCGALLWSPLSPWPGTQTSRQALLHAVPYAVWLLAPPLPTLLLSFCWMLNSS